MKTSALEHEVISGMPNVTCYLVGIICHKHPTVPVLSNNDSTQRLRVSVRVRVRISVKEVTGCNPFHM